MKSPTTWLASPSETAPENHGGYGSKKVAIVEWDADMGRLDW